MRLAGRLGLLLCGAVLGAGGCMAAPEECGCDSALAAAMGDPPHSRFHPVPTRPVFESGVVPASHWVEPPAPLDAIPPPELADRQKDPDEPELLPKEIARPLDPRFSGGPTSRRR
jgi:hypothetical protein